MASPVSGSGEANFNRRIVIEGNHIAANAVHASGSMHNQYLQGESFVVQGNYLARNRAGSAGSTLKIRSTGAWVRYNYIEGTARDVDFVEIQDWMQYVIPKQASFPELGDANDPWTWDDLVTLHELYQHHFMYGNVLNDDNSTGATPTFSIHYFHDIFPDTNHSATTDTELGGTLYLYHNSWRMNGATARSQYAIDGSRAPAAAIPNQWPSVYLVNNAISLEGSVNFKWATATSDRLTLDKNWISTGWDAGANHLGNVTGFFNYQCGETSDTKCYPSAFATGNHHVADFGRLVTGTSPFTSTTTYAPAAALVGSAQALPSAISDLPPLVSYSPATQAWTVRSSAADMGAIDGGTAPDPPASNGVTFSGVTLSGVTVQ
jgi:hypothetical protein